MNDEAFRLSCHIPFAYLKYIIRHVLAFGSAALPPHLTLFISLSSNSHARIDQARYLCTYNWSYYAWLDMPYIYLNIIVPHNIYHREDIPIVSRRLNYFQSKINLNWCWKECHGVRSRTEIDNFAKPLRMHKLSCRLLVPSILCKSARGANEWPFRETNKATEC